MTEMRSTRPVVNGSRHWLVEAGPDDGLPLVLIHGFPLSHVLWLPQLEAFSGRFRVAAYDLRGLGRTEVGDGQYTMEAYVDDLLGVMDHLSFDRAVLCGLSMGGYVALRAVERAPDRVRGLILCDTRSGADTNAGKVGRAAAIEQVKRDGTAAFARDFLPKVLGPTSLGQRPEVVRTVEQMMAEQRVPGVIGAQLAMAGRTDTTEALHQVVVPALLVVGEEDTLTPPAQSREMAARIPESELVLVPDAGHLSNLENPDGFNRPVLEFLDRLATP